MDLIGGFLTILLSAAAASAATFNLPCATDSDCIYPNTYCYAEHQCAYCTDCSLYQRHPGPGCAKTKDQCGGCLDGLTADTNIDGTLSVCHPVGTQPPVNHGDEPHNTSNTLLYIIGAIIGIAVILVPLAIYCIYNKGRGNITDPERFLRWWPLRHCPSRTPPPPYTEKCPSAPPFENVPPAPDPPIAIYRPIENEPNQTANVCVTPQYVTGGTYGTNTEQEQAENQSLLPENPLPDEEETQPSSWTPTSNTSAPTSFENVLLEHLNISQPTEEPEHVEPPSNNRSGSDISINFERQNTSGTSDSPNPTGNININILQINQITNS